MTGVNTLFGYCIDWTRDRCATISTRYIHFVFKVVLIEIQLAQRPRNGAVMKMWRGKIKVIVVRISMAGVECKQMRVHHGRGGGTSSIVFVGLTP